MFGKNRSKSVVLIIISFFWVGYLAVSATQFYLNTKDVTEKQLAERRRQMQYVQESFLPLIISENFSLLKDRLESSRDLQFLDFYILQENESVVLWHNNKNNLAGINVNYKTFNKVLQTDEIAFRTVKIQDYKFTVGILQNPYRLMWQTALTLKGFFIRDFLFVTSILGLIVYLVLKDIINLSKALSSRSRDNIANIKTRSREGETLIKASLGLENERLRLEQLSETYGETVGPALRHELQSGREAPYHYTATLCRIDLNGYTQIFLQKDDKYLSEILNQYFVRAREAIQRYDGLIYQFVGDEIVFQFKDDLMHGLPSQQVAIACIRDLFSEAQEIEASLASDANHYFKLKGSFSHGTMRFTALDEGHALSGLPLIESVRLLSLIDEKNHQVMAFFGEDSTWAEDLLSIQSRSINRLKGFKEDSIICSALNFTSLDSVFASRQWHQLTYFRSDTHVLSILQLLKDRAQSHHTEGLNEILSALQQHKCSAFTPEILHACEDALSCFMHSEYENKLETKSLASLISLIGRLIPTCNENDVLYSLITKLLNHSNSRVQANTIVVLGQFNVSLQTLTRKMFSSNNRVAADSIIAIAKKELNADIVKALNLLLHQNEPRHQASGQYALKQILKYYKEKDPVYLKTNRYLSEIQKWSAQQRAS